MLHMLRGSDKFDFVNVYAGGSVNVMFQRKCTAIFIENGYVGLGRQTKYCPTSLVARRQRRRATVNCILFARKRGLVLWRRALDTLSVILSCCPFRLWFTSFHVFCVGSVLHVHMPVTPASQHCVSAVWTVQLQVSLVHGTACSTHLALSHIR